MKTDFTPMQIAVYAVNCNNTDEDINNVNEAIKKYARQVLDHVAEKCTVDWGNGFTLIDKESIINIKDEL